MNIEAKAKDFYGTKRVKKIRKYDHPVVRAYALDIIKFIKANVTLTPQPKVLEIGAGGGYVSHYLDQDCDLLATDSNEQFLSQNPVKNKQIADANKLPFADNQFEVVLIVNMLHHLDDPAKALAEAIRVSSRYVILIEPDSANWLIRLIATLFPRERGMFRFSRDYLAGLISQANLKVLHQQPVSRLVTPNMPLPLWLLNLVPENGKVGWNVGEGVVCEK